jgi:hypothetical protein
MSTFNGIGTRFHGCSEIHKDGSCLSTKWFCLVFPLVPLGTWRIWPETHDRRLLGMYSATTFRAKPSGLYLPHVGKVYGLYLAIYLALVLVDRFGTGEWHFS